jgi:hypothetical protein
VSIKKHRIVIAGWFSFDLPHNTAGDLLARQTALTWATEAGYTCDIAVPYPTSPKEIATDKINPHNYDAAVFVCGPDRYAKKTNPNWSRICQVIPGYEAYKKAKYRQLSKSIQI